MTDLRDAQRLIVFGGSFDPPHLAHVALPELVRQKIGADLVAYVPAGRAPHKLDQPQTPAHHRLAMLRLALADSPRCVILTDEIERASQGLPSYTVDTLEALRGRLGPNVRMWLLIGADQWRIFSQWKSPRRIMELAQPLVMIRPPDTAESLSASLPQEAVSEGWTPQLVNVPPMKISSTDIRRRVAQGQPISHLVPPQVEQYIREHGLYRA